MKVLAIYLPQYHRIKENDEWWGEGYTEWTAVRSAHPCYKGHKQPRVPLSNNYYDLADQDANTWKWQAELAKEYGVYGFCIYHYWFKTGKQLMERPMEILLKHPEIDLNYCFCWANENWTRKWDGKEKLILMEQEYGDEEEWERHFNYLLDFFMDSRYIKIENKPMINIYHSADIDCLDKMITCWNKLAKKNGFDGVYVVSGNTWAKLDNRKEIIDAYYNFEPLYTFRYKCNFFDHAFYKITSLLRTGKNIIFRTKYLEKRVSSKMVVKSMSKPDRYVERPIFPGAYPQWDNTPRRGYKGIEYYGMDISLFKRQLDIAKYNYKNAEFIYVNAWNEWGESAYLEPDSQMKYSCLEVICNEFKK